MNTTTNTPSEALREVLAKFDRAEVLSTHAAARAARVRAAIPAAERLEREHAARGEALRLIYRRLQESAGGGRTPRSRKSLRALAGRALGCDEVGADPMGVAELHRCTVMRLQREVGELRRTVTRLVDAAHSVLTTWEEGDLAAAVRELAAAVDSPGVVAAITEGEA